MHVFGIARSARLLEGTLLKRSQPNTFENILYTNSLARNFFLLYQIDRYLLSGLSAVWSALRVAKVKPDYAIIYSSNILYIIPVLFFLALSRIPFCFDVVEHYQPYQYKWGNRSPFYLTYSFLFNKIYPLSGKLIGISQYLCEYFRTPTCKTLLVPVLYEVKSSTYSHCISESKSYESKQILRLLYSGNPGKKEDVSTMLRSVHEFNHFNSGTSAEIHFTGTSRARLLKETNVSAIDISILDSCAVFHEFYPYDDLIGTYKQMHFLFFVREATLSNLANYPTKLIELMALGIPPIISDVGDYGTLIVDGHNGFKIKESCPLSVARILQAATSLSCWEYALMRTNAAQTIENNNDYKLYSRALDEFIFSI